MASKILADASILIDLQKGKQSTIHLFSKNQDTIAISRITACEFIYGSRNNKEKKINENFLNNLDIIDINESISELTYSLLNKYSLKTNLGIADAMIAATAIFNELSLWTLDTKHLSKIKELELFDY